MTSNRCPHCGNLIPSWAHGICQICVRIDQERKRYGDRGRALHRTRHPRRKPKKTGTKSPKKRKTKRVVSVGASARRPSRPLHKQQCLVRLKGFNRLLKDVYGRRIWLSDLLIKNGVSREQIALWKEDIEWLLHFTSTLETLLLKHLSQAVPGKDPHILKYWYGLKTPRTHSAKSIASRLGTTTSNVRDGHSALLEYLRGDAGKLVLEKAVMVASRDSTVS